MHLTWTNPSHPGMARFAMWDGTIFAYVTGTARQDGAWRIAVFPSGKDDGAAIGAYVKTEALGQKFIEAWAARNHHRIVVKERKRMPHETPLPPRKPKGSDERS